MVSNAIHTFTEIHQQVLVDRRRRRVAKYVNYYNNGILLLQLSGLLLRSVFSTISTLYVHWANRAPQQNRMYQIKLEHCIIQRCG